jgi:hypothetical protein
MKQQQTSIEFLSLRAIFSCRFCDIEFQNRNNLRRNIVFHDRYHHDVLIFRQQSLIINEKTKKIIFLFKHDLKSQSSFFQNLTFVFDFIMNCFSNFTYFEY